MFCFSPFLWFPVVYWKVLPSVGLQHLTDIWCLVIKHKGQSGTPAIYKPVMITVTLIQKGGTLRQRSNQLINLIGIVIINHKESFLLVCGLIG